MIDLYAVSNEDELVDILLDLKHDLAKYFLLNVSHLSHASTMDEVKCALQKGLYQTRKVRGVYQSATEIWEKYKLEIQDVSPNYDRWRDLETAVLNILQLDRFLTSESDVILGDDVVRLGNELSQLIVQLVKKETQSE